MSGLPSPCIRILCVDDHAIVRHGISLIINQEPDMRVVAATGTGEEAVSLFRQERPDITLMDLRLKGSSGTTAIEAIRREDANARIIVLTMYDGDEDVHRALKAGAVTYLLKEMLSDDLIRAVRDVHAGRRPINREVEARLAEHATHPSLTPREVEVVGLLARGLRNKEIGASLGITERTTQVHLKSIFHKLNVNDRTSAITVALRRGIVHVG